MGFTTGEIEGDRISPVFSDMLRGCFEWSKRKSSQPAVMPFSAGVSEITGPEPSPARNVWYPANLRVA
jgi:hypothetical protein